MNAALGVTTRLRRRRGLVLLHSARDDDGCGQWSFVACDPVHSIEAHGDTVSLYDRSGMVRDRFKGNPLELLSEMVRDHIRRWTDEIAGPVPVAMGYLGYELGRLTRPYRKGTARRVDDLPDMWFGIYDAVWRFDEKSRRSDIVGKSAGARRTLAEAIARGDDTRRRLPVFDPLLPHGVHGAMAEDEERDEARRRVELALDTLRTGAVKRVDLSRRLAADVREPGDPLALYASLLRSDPSPFSAFVTVPKSNPDERSFVLSSSCDRFLYRAPGSDVLGTRPGERPERRPDEDGDDDEASATRAAALAAEAAAGGVHTALVEEASAELARLTEEGGAVTREKLGYVVEAPDYLRVVSRLGCRVRPNLNEPDILNATFPSAALSGVPKKLALELIDALESTQRGLEGGAIGYLGLGKALDLSLASHVAVLGRDRIVTHATARVTKDSTPESWFEATDALVERWRSIIKS